MKHIDGDMTVHRILTRFPHLLEEFKVHGLGKFEAPETLEKLGPYLTLRSALAALSINQELFIARLEARITSEAGNGAAEDAFDVDKRHELTVSALLPCGMKMPFGRTLDAFIESYNRTHSPTIRCLVEGNVNHETSYYDHVDTITSLDQLPDVVISADINSFYHQRFKRMFRGQGLFRTSPRRLHPDMEAIGLADPDGDFTMLSANLLVIVALSDGLRGRPLPESWGDLLHESFTNSVVMRGDDSFFCNGVLLPFHQMFGLDGVRRLGRSVVQGLHPSEMVKLIDSRNADVPPVYVMPYFFATRIKERGRATLIVPNEGAIVSPVQMLVKRSARPEVMDAMDFLTGRELGQICADAYFPSTHPGVTNPTSHVRMRWLGWDFLNRTDIGALKNEVGAAFKAALQGSEDRACG
jgi:ABC-type Fe3+ transport system substrate-binding protein